MLNWIARRRTVDALAERVATLDRRLAETADRMEAETARATALVDRLDALSGRTDALADRMDEIADRLDGLNALSDRLGEVEERARRVDDERSSTADYLDRSIVRYDAQLATLDAARHAATDLPRELDRLRVELGRLTRRFDLQAADAAVTATALLDRIERVRARS